MKKSTPRAPVTRLPDVLGPGLRIVFVGTAVGSRSASVGAYYADPRNAFWRTLHAVGLTPVEFEPAEFRGLLKCGIGLTDLSKSEAGMDHEIDAATFDTAALRRKIQRYAPDAVGFTSKAAAEVFLTNAAKPLSYGWQAQGLGSTPHFVLPSTSGAARRHWSIEPWQELAHWFHARGA